ncbi:hypothetical protein OG607_16070 [Streptomyces sp. NBC_01537]|uniref:hypothetical protein n=1 Tax=Streptomyces sp. NBC_01537 TaxID=2903896 RepID=UPI003865435F
MKSISRFTATPRTKGRTAGIRRSLSVLAATGALAAAAVTFAPSAQADSSICNPGCEAAADFQSYGEVFTVHDYDADGYSTVGYIYSYSPGDQYTHTCLNTNGAAGAAKTCNYEFEEDYLVSYQVCKYKTSTGLDYDCSGVVYDYS